MTDTVNDDTRASSISLKKRTYSMHERMKALGYESKLTHCYELLATAYGYRSWNAMKATTTDVTPNLVDIPTCRTADAAKREEPIVVKTAATAPNDEVFPPRKSLFFPNLSSDEWAFQVTGANDIARSYVLANIAGNAIKTNSSAIFFTASNNTSASNPMTNLAVASGRCGDIVKFSLSSESLFNRRGFDAAAFNEISTAMFTLSAVLPALLWLHKNKTIVLSVDTIKSYLLSEKIDELLAFAENGMPTEISSPLKDYFDAFSLTKKTFFPPDHPLLIDDFVSDYFSDLERSFTHAFVGLPSDFSFNNILDSKKIAVIDFPSDATFSVKKNKLFGFSLPSLPDLTTVLAKEKYDFPNGKKHTPRPDIVYEHFHKCYMQLTFNVFVLLLGSIDFRIAPAELPVVLFDNFDEFTLESMAHILPPATKQQAAIAFSWSHAPNITVREQLSSIVCDDNNRAAIVSKSKCEYIHI